MLAADEGIVRQKKRRKKADEGELSIAVCQRALRLPLGNAVNDVSPMEVDRVRVLKRCLRAHVLLMLMVWMMATLAVCCTMHADVCVHCPRPSYVCPLDIYIMAIIPSPLPHPTDTTLTQDPPPKVSGNLSNLKIYGLSRNQRVTFIKTLMRFGAQRDASGMFHWPSGLEHLTPKVVEAMHAYGRKVRGAWCLPWGAWCLTWGAWCLASGAWCLTWVVMSNMCGRCLCDWVRLAVQTHCTTGCYPMHSRRIALHVKCCHAHAHACTPQVMDMLMAEGLDPHSAVLDRNVPRKEVLFDHTTEVWASLGSCFDCLEACDARGA